MMDQMKQQVRENMTGKILKGKYKFERQLGEGGAGTVYLCRNLQLGNLWAVKHIAKEEKRLQLNAEIEVLKRLNHIYLPQIIDIIEDESGTYIVRSYIEGIDLGKKLKEEGSFDENTVLGWARQICSAMIYLHNMKPFPIIYRDMKPENIIITRDNMAVVVDFGTSKEYREDAIKDLNNARTPCYAAPEQMSKNGISDKRTDIYSFGITLYHLLAGHLPDENRAKLWSDSDFLSQEIIELMEKCIQVKPEDRYQSFEELKKDLDAIGVEIQQEQSKNRLIIPASIVMSLISFWMVYLGLTGLARERGAIVTAYPETMVLSIQQEGEYGIEKSYADGTKEIISSSKIKWTSSNDDIAVVKNGKVQGINTGEAELTGSYRDKVLKTTVWVSKRQDDINKADIYLKYLRGVIVKPFAGTGKHTDDNGDISDGKLDKAIMSSPTSIVCVANDEVFVSDAGKLRMIKDGIVKSLDVDATIVRKDMDGNVYYLTNYFGKNQEAISEIRKYDGNKTLEVYKHIEYGELLDFTFDKSNCIYMLFGAIDRDKTSRVATRVVFYNPVSKQEQELRVVEGIMNSITVDKNDDIYISCASNFAIYKWEKGSKVFSLFAGQRDKKNYIDGKNNNFFAPKKIIAKDDFIYVIDYNVIRRITVYDGKLVDVESLAGKPLEGEKSISESKGVDSWFKSPDDIDIDKDGNILVADSKNYVIWKIGFNSVK